MHATQLTRVDIWTMNQKCYDEQSSHQRLTYFLPLSLDDEMSCYCSRLHKTSCHAGKPRGSLFPQIQLLSASSACLDFPQSALSIIRRPWRGPETELRCDH
ncbi:uncharacterized protein LAESUDRAFT_298470 [Laetiporus sulphureus 93-53]|uniref:Uncharacterized protein n=1 Tax=Laetiporus sulphureus 93-53 TaxID=1314785 RepID=A0A165DBS6_9APHY|nr:uncharacterized protein LAESUDRAFT_298470 [Laetiporus sulphureus 93-53]KZT04506.1 hypothetical protein LAESUDRAFT_298470 [Laetiporus sulphureus 93-53]